MKDRIRLADFIRQEMEPILQDWEAFAKSILPASRMERSDLRDHATQMLQAIADDLDSHQSAAAQADKSKGCAPAVDEDSWAEVHGSDRQTSGFSVMETVSEFRALRASVVSHWTKAYPRIAGQQLEDLTRFHEAIDQAVAESLEQFATTKEMETRLFGAILFASPDPIYVLDPAGRVVYANKATAELFSLDPQAIIGKSAFDLGFTFASEFQRNVEQVITGQSIHRGKLDHSFASGQGNKFEYVLAPVLDEHGETEAVVCILRDITQQVIAEEKIWYHAHHDHLTGLPNRRLFVDRLEQEVSHAKRSNLMLGVLFMDLDGFKEVNDSFGHEAGDRLLSEVAVRITSCLRKEDIVSRLGGDEFTVIVTGAAQCNDVERIAQTIIQTLEAPFRIGPDPVRISVSIGVSFYPADASFPSALLEAADEAMYMAKKSDTHWACFADIPKDTVDR
ncbi:diguanylate cyclase domain-containing protein [Thioalkalivibrio sp. AKL19]|uniref:diguanylate cyclase domain-containing protein n=1 Tax=Thioalkalivibrio sp. AKL19 TaxID=1266914 RepID=UPI0004213B8E|nr:diguanylate cyclase [Thioalkalivibrio sp. AKL19]